MILLIHRHNINHYFLCRAEEFGNKDLTEDEINSFHLSTLKLSYEELKSRLGDLSERGVSIREGQTLLDLYEERKPLYEKYADYVVDCEGKSIREVVEEMTKLWKKETKK